MNFEPSTPDPQTTVLVTALIRHVLTFLGGIGVVHGTYSDSTIQIIAGAVIGIAAAGWSLWQKYQAARLDHDGSVRSVGAGTPMRAIG